MYPFPLHTHRLFATLAAQRGEPSVQELLDDTTKSEVQHLADWQQVVHYLNSLNLNSMAVHWPLLN